MQSVVMQKEALSVQANEIGNALEEVGKAGEKQELYKVSGPVLIKSTKQDIEKDLKEKKELLELKIKTLEKSEKRIKERMDELREKLVKAG